MQKFIINIHEPDENIITDARAVCHVLSSELEPIRLQHLVNELKATESLVLFSGVKAAEACREFQGDGVFVSVSSDKPYKKQILPVRDAVGAKKVLGVEIPLQRHAAMVVGETEPDFMSFRVDSNEDIAKAKELLAWYNDLFLIQICVGGTANCAELISLPADFVMISPRDFKILVAQKESLD